MEQSLAAEKMYLSSEVITRQVIGSLCPRNTLISEESGATSWRDKREVKVIKKNFLRISYLESQLSRRNLTHLHLWQ